MPSGEKVENRLKTLAMVVVFGIFAFYVPLRLANSENHTRLSMLEPFRLLGPVLVAFGVIGYIMSIWRFIVEAEASPMLGDSGKNYHHGDLSLHEKPNLHLRLVGDFWGIPLFHFPGPCCTT